jgi:hypothetical protein
MITTIKLKLKSEIDITDFQKQFNNVYRYSYNRFFEKNTKFQQFSNLKNIKNCHLLDISWKREAIKVANASYQKDKKTKMIFGGKHNFYKLKNHKITKSEFNKLKNIPISCEGSSHDKGNRKFKFDSEKLKGSVKLFDKIINFETENTSKHNIKLLTEALELSKQKKIAISYKLSNEYVWISFDINSLKLQNYKFIKDRGLSLDMNPNYIGLSIVDNGKNIIYKEVFNLLKLNNNLSKKNYELIEIAKHIKQLCLHYKVEIVGFEDISIHSKNHNKGKKFNRNINNNWNRNLFLNSLKKHLELINCKYQELYPQYSSFIGCVMYLNDTDSIAASLELNRRLYEFKKIYIDKQKCQSKKHGIMFPEWNINLLSTRWKEMVISNGHISDWKSLYNHVKKSKTSYRLSFEDLKKSEKVCRFKSSKSLIDKILYFN